MLSRPSQPLIPLILMIAATTAVADNTVIGKIEADFDAEPRIWYVVQPNKELMPTAFWFPVTPNINAAAIVAYDSPDLQFEQDEASGATIPIGDSSAFVVTVTFGAEKRSESDADHSAASVRWLADWRAKNSTFDLGRDTGNLNVTSIKTSMTGTSQFSGTFDGTFEDDSGSTISVTNGRFSVDGAKYQDP